MIHVFFVAGMFGSTIEYVLRNFTNEYEKIPGEISADGSMHSFKKEYHPGSLARVDPAISLNSRSITTPMYPFPEMHLEGIIDILRKQISTFETDRRVLLYASSLYDAELNMLFQYHKIATGDMIHKGLGIFFGNNAHNIVNWNPNYTHWSEMEQWELREWFSLFYVQWVQEWIVSQHQVDDSWLCIKNTDILYNPLAQFKRIINFCELTEVDGIELFADKWHAAQQYIVDEFDLIDKIVTATINNSPLRWNDLNIIAEAIIQQRLRSTGYEVRCDGLNTFPTDSETLYNLLEKV